jgi:hypothetical protein
LSKIPSDTVQAAQRLLAERERVGLAKYGTTVDRTDLQAGDWLQHAIEEASDLLLYLIRLRERIMREKEDADRAAYLARWANAPAEATHLVQDDDGFCRWSAGYPEPVAGGWIVNLPFLANTGWASAGQNLLGRVACEPRPEVQP